MPFKRLQKNLVLTEDEFREVIARATREEFRRVDGISLEVLHQVAQELNIDPLDLQHALGEVVGTPDTTRPVRSWLSLRFTSLCRTIDQMLPQRGRLLVGAITGSFLGWVTAYVALGLQTIIDGVAVSMGSSSFIDVPVVALLILLTFANSLSRRARGGFRRYVMEVAMVWGTFGIAWSVTSGRVTDDLASLVLSAIAVATAWGWLVVRRKDGHGETSAPHRVHVALPVAPAIEPRDTDPLERDRAHGLVPLLAFGLSVRC